MKKSNQRKQLVLDKVTIQALTTQQLDHVAGGAQSKTLTICFTQRTCASVEFSC